VWDTALFALNILAFIFIGLQIRPILEALEPAQRAPYFAVAGAVLATVILVRFAWHMSFNALTRWRDGHRGFHPPRPMLRPTVGSGLVVSWAGMRGIVTLAAALALPDGFPYRDLIVLTAFSVVLGTLVIQGLTLKPLMRLLDLQDGDPVATEVAAAREGALRAALESFAGEQSPLAELLRKELKATLAGPADGANTLRASYGEMRRAALRAARQAVFAMRSSEAIGDDAFHRMEEELDWLEMVAGAE
jgi:CPA1 family monovalent cation:H+ antiporter